MRENIGLTRKFWLNETFIAFDLKGKKKLVISRFSPRGEFKNLISRNKFQIIFNASLMLN